MGFAFDARIPDLISRVTAEDVQRVARLNMQQPTVVIVAPLVR